MVPNAQYLSANMTSQFPSAPTDMYGMHTDDMMNAAMNSGSADIGQASQMAPPSINVEFAPPLRNPSFGPNKPATDLDSLSPPAMSAFLSVISFKCLKFSSLLQDPVCAASLIRIHTPPLGQDLQRLRLRVLSLMLPLPHVHCHLTRAAIPAHAMRHRHDLIDGFQPRPLTAETTSWTWLILSALERCLGTRSVFRSTLRLSSAHYARNGSLVHITCGPTFELTQTNGRSYVRSAARHLPGNTTESDTRDFTRAKRNSFVVASCREVDIGVAAVGLRVQMH